jgi:predicted protein tyrosine phosphatase
MPDAPPIKVLFVCRQNRKRSATAERLFCKRADLDVRSAGTAPDALVRVNTNMLDWADAIFVMDDDQRRWLEAAFPDNGALAKVICLDIPDVFTFLQPELIQLLEQRVPPHLAGLSSEADKPARNKI